MLTAARQVVLLAHVNPDADALGSALALGLALHRRGRRGPGVVRRARAPRRVAARPRRRRARRHRRRGRGRARSCSSSSTPAASTVSARWPTAPRTAGTTLVIDHHVSNAGFGTHYYVDPRAEATAVMVLHLLDAMGAPVDLPTARCLYAGLVTDTRNFRAASPDTHAMAARLLVAGVDAEAVTRPLLDTHPFSWLAMLSAVLATARLEAGEARGLGLVHALVEREHVDGGRQEEVESVIDVLRTTAEAEVAVVLKQVGERRWTASMRSKGGIDVAAAAVRARRRRAPRGLRLHPRRRRPGDPRPRPARARRRPAAGMTTAPPDTDPGARRVLALASSALVVLVAEPLYLLVDTAVVGHLGAVPLAGPGRRRGRARPGREPGHVPRLRHDRARRAPPRRRATVPPPSPRAWRRPGSRCSAGLLVVGARLARGALGGRPARRRGSGRRGGHRLAADRRVGRAGHPRRARRPRLDARGAGHRAARSSWCSPATGSPPCCARCWCTASGRSRRWGSRARRGRTSGRRRSVGLLFVGALVRERRVRCARAVADMRAQFGLGRDLLLRSAAFQACFLSATAVAARFGAPSVAAHQIVLQLWTFMVTVLDALAIAAQSLVGAALGAAVGGGRAARERAGHPLRPGAGPRRRRWCSRRPRACCRACSPPTPRCRTSCRRPGGSSSRCSRSPPTSSRSTGCCSAPATRPTCARITVGSALGAFLPTIWLSLVLDWGLAGIWAGLSLFIVARAVAVGLRVRGEAWAVTGT